MVTLTIEKEQRKIHIGLTLPTSTNTNTFINFNQLQSLSLSSSLSSSSTEWKQTSLWKGITRHIVSQNGVLFRIFLKQELTPKRIFLSLIILPPYPFSLNQYYKWFVFDIFLFFFGIHSLVCDKGGPRSNNI